MPPKKKSKQREASLSIVGVDTPMPVCFNDCPILLGKSIDFFEFTTKTPSFRLEEYFENIGWSNVITISEYVYPNLIREFYRNLSFHSLIITCDIKGKWITLDRNTILRILELDRCENFAYDQHHSVKFEGYNEIEACSRVTDRPLSIAMTLNLNHLTIPCKILHRAIAYVIVPRSGHFEEVHHFDLFLLDSLLVGRILDFPYIFLNHIRHVHKAARLTLWHASYYDFPTFQSAITR